MADNKHLVKQLTKPIAFGTDALVYWEVITHTEDDVFHNYFIEEKHAYDFTLAQSKAGHIAWKYKQVAYSINQLANITFDDENCTN